jgi:two-component system C4-dicarboxylate transport sensor histidine kinase DctB
LSLANQSLEQEVSERRLAEDELRQTQTELIQAGKLAALGQMSAALSHEFNQPLTAIRTYAENAITLFERGRQAEAEENIKQVSQLTEHMAELSKHLSRFARKPQIKTRPVSLTGALRETLSLLQGRMEKQAVEAVIELPSEEVWVIGGHIRLQQVMMNLITNALDAMRGEALQVLEIRAARQDGRVRLTIADSGAGIVPEIFDKIFDPFVTTKDVGQGLGLGLSISFNIIKDLGGSLTARNRDEGGACFTVDLKAAKPAEELVDKGRS